MSVLNMCACVCMLQRADQGEENADQSCQVNSSMWPGPAAAHTQPVEYYSAALGAMLRDWRDSKGKKTGSLF
jgi:hypothetical protein